LLEKSVTALKGVGKQLATKLEKLGLYTLQDLVFYLPYRYVDRTKVTPIGSLSSQQSVVIEGEIRGADILFGKRRSLLCKVQDGTGVISLRFYYFSNSQKQAMTPGTKIRCFGETRTGASGIEIYHPEYQLLNHEDSKPLEQTLTPTYSTTEGITQPRLRSLIQQAFEVIAQENPPDLFAYLYQDKNQRNTHKVNLTNRLYYLHFPPKDADINALTEATHPYQEQLILEELAAYQLSLLRLRQKRQLLRALPLAKTELINQFLESLPFEPTHAQHRVCQEITDDLAKNTPMMRLLQGDVGSGKTMVAAYAALHAIAQGQQVALMAPTEILAEQHRIGFGEWFKAFDINIGWLSGKQNVGERREQLKAIAEGQCSLVIGTHALFQEDVEFNNLALVIIDEQHRFGVNQRLQLKNKGASPHQLIMTATPIPRTLAMSAYADLDYSVIDELPKGRTPIETVVISQKRRDEIIDRIRHACHEGRQVYWVCTLIEQSESLSAEAAEDTCEVLKEQLSSINVGLVHGRLKSEEKQFVMEAFHRGDIQLLVATTVIEVGVNVPNASLMIIENPERLGLAQLHQLRGRVGRGSIASHCVLLYGEALSEHGKARLQAMRSTSDGFRIAEIDLELRGPGEVLGTRQTGDIAFKVADLQRDNDLLPELLEKSKQLLEQEPEIAEQLIQRWIGQSERFAQA
jgi:ATP-dependent DNA helicase RecG